ncbi:MAG: NUDIX hydrolase [Halofilum sp. (in: g-proteobacteria)]
MTVAAVVEQDDRFLVVEEMAEGHRVFNQPAGHLEPDESLLQAVIREVLEETRGHFRPQNLVGLYRWCNPATLETHMRVTFCGTLNGSDPERPLDDPIIEPHWLSYDDLRALDGELRSPLVLSCIDDYLRGCRYPLELLRDLG